jgi:hypothetical protein
VAPAGGSAGAAGGGRHSLYYDLVDLFDRPGCPVCRLSLAGAYRWLDAFAFEGVNDVDLRAELRATRGFCNVHAWQLIGEVHDLLGAAIVYRDVVHTSLPAVSEAVRRPEALEPRGVCRACTALEDAGARYLDVFRESLAVRLAPADDCAWCVARAAAEGWALDRLLDGLGPRSALADALGRSGGLCRPHFVRAMERGAGSPAAARLAHIEQARWTALRDALLEYIRQADYRFRAEPKGEEQAAPWWATEQVAGAQGIRP